jgi:GNAT superfamily N-acetyltransferase
MIIYEDVNLIDIFDEIKLIIGMHYDELCVTKEFPLDPDWDHYEKLTNAGLIRTITVRNEKELIGYMVFFVRPHNHYKTCKTAFEDLYFVKPEYRKGRVGIKMFQYAEEALKRIGVNRIVVHTKIHSDNSRLLEYLDYHQTDKLFTKIL